MQRRAARLGYHGVILAGYLAVAVALYWRALGAFFVSDDFEFLSGAVSSSSWWGDHPDAVRFIRPLVSLAYVVCYRLFGLDPAPYHVAVLLIHVFNAWCVTRLAERLLPGRPRLLALLAGVLFLVFSSHSEAVAWVAGVADPILTALALPALLAYLRALDPGSSRGWMAVSIALMLAGALAKESWVVLPPIVLVHAILFVGPSAVPRRRAAVIAGSGLLAVAAYLALRSAVLGSVTGGYAGLGSSLSSGTFVDTARAFVLRCFIPGGLRALAIWEQRLDLFVWPALAVALAIAGRGRGARVALFAAAAMLLALAPTLPLTISIVNTESERFTYLPTAFSCLLVVAAGHALLRRRELVAVACIPLVAWHAVVMVRNTTRLRAAGEIARGIVDSFAGIVRAHAGDRPQPVFLLNLPDNLGGTYVYRRGFYPAVALFAPDVAAIGARTVGVATNALGSRADRATVRRTGDRRFVVEFDTPSIVQPQIGSSVWYRIAAQTPMTYEIEFADTVREGLVIYTSGGRIASAGAVNGAGVPFGTLEIPQDGEACRGSSLRFSGWALGEYGVETVALEVVDDGREPRPLGEARWVTGTRPDVTSRFDWLPNAQRAEWDYDLPCAGVTGAPGGAMRIRATAIDRRGQRTELGTRLVKGAP